MRTELQALREAALAEVAAARTEPELEAVRVRYLGRKGSLTTVVRGLRDVPPEERPAVGALVNDAKEAVEAACVAAAERLAREGLVRRLAEERVDVTLPGRQRVRGHVHPLRLLEDELVDVFLGMGFEVADGPEIEDDEHNFEALNIPRDHPARDMQDTLFVGADDLLLRTHTSSVQVRVMRSRRPPLRVVAPGTVYRRDEPDPTHSPMFQQIEGFMVDETVSFADLKGVVTTFLRALFGPDTAVRFQPTFFPFTEPSAQFDISCFCTGSGRDADPGCRLCRGRGWLEIGGSGMIHPNVLRAVGYDPDAVRGFAFGFGIDRIATIRYGVDDLRLFYDCDVRFLSQF